ncbi:MAG: hypothetical protein V8T41_01910 [Oscillospiraceae bacterium]
MKRTITALLTALLLALSLCVPAAASVEYGSIFDETEELGSAELTYQGEEKLPQLGKISALTCGSMYLPTRAWIRMTPFRTLRRLSTAITTTAWARIRKAYR